MTTEPVGIEVLGKDILERAGIERRDDLPITIECVWGANPDGSPRILVTGKPHPLVPDQHIYEIFQNPTEIKVYSLRLQSNGAPAKNPEEEMRTNPTRMTLVKTSRCSVTEIMVHDVFVESIVQDLLASNFETYGPDPEDDEDGKKSATKEPLKEPSSPGTKPQLVPPSAGS
jgi:hypothetical protein